MKSQLWLRVPDGVVSDPELEIRHSDQYIFHYCLCPSVISLDLRFSRLSNAGQGHLPPKATVKRSNTITDRKRF